MAELFFLLSGSLSVASLRPSGKLPKADFENGSKTQIYLIIRSLAALKTTGQEGSS